MKGNCSGIILAGGRSLRMQGNNKAFLKIGGIRLIDRVIDTLLSIFDQVLIVAKDASMYEKFNLPVVEDLLDAQSPLAGIHAGLLSVSTDFAFFVGCDTPFIKREVIEILLDEIEQQADVIVPYSGLYYQPLCAVYSKRCVPVIEAQLEAGDMKVDHFFYRLNVKTVSYDLFEGVDRNLLSFFNVNDPSDLHRAEQLLRSGP
ncbi:MAG: molybdenum cofactor guanylyltransferase [Deltaproteobacteria bacterium]|nr:molybdenum cofactor guanylyltransferase [Deltaproteobacteria bacterium]MBW1961676.1 molybdenum cofactor guanylyltransferase [Deltaproteobacteria bacterium]MBW2153468.1 molybdenum cofactor guanylyltransferase [Deltaproteobacteria bacterium]